MELPELRKIPAVTLLLVAITSSAISQTVESVATASSINDGIAISAEGNIFVSRFFGTTVARVTPDGVTSIYASGMSSPNGIYFDYEGYLWVPSHQGNQVYRVTSDSTKELIIDNIGTPSNIIIDSVGNMYITRYQTNKIMIRDSSDSLYLWSSNPLLNGPIDMEIGKDGTFFIANYNDGRIFRIDSLESWTTIADLPTQLGFMTLVGDVIYATGINNNKIYKVQTDGSGQSEFAGTGIAGSKNGHISVATFNGPNGIAATSSGDTLYISDFNSSTLRRIIGINTPIGTKVSGLLPKEYLLSQNFPNPFNPVTSIEYTLPMASEIVLMIYNIRGENVVRLIEGGQSAGYHSVVWDASNVSSGIYFYRLQAGDFVQTRKMVLLK